MRKMCIFAALIAICLMFCCETDAIETCSKKGLENALTKNPLFNPPHLVSSKNANPKEIWIKDSGVIPEVVTVTLTVNAVGDLYNGSDVAATALPMDPIVKDVLPPYIEYQGSWDPTFNNTARINNFNFIQGITGMWEMWWTVPQMKINETFEVQYKIKSTLSGWQSIGVTKANTSIYGGDYCRVKYQNYKYLQTGDPLDIWTNETKDVSILVKDPGIPEIPVILLSSSFMMIAFFFISAYCRKRKRKAS